MANSTLISIISKETANNTAEIGFKINPDHIVFKGHFPGSPIVPGVLEMQIAEMLIVEVLAIQIKLHQVSNVKFLKPIYPNEDNLYSCEIEYTIVNSLLDCVITIKCSNFAHMKMTCNYKIDPKNSYNHLIQEEAKSEIVC